MLVTAKQVEETTFEIKRNCWYRADAVDELLDEVVRTLRAHEEGLLAAGLMRVAGKVA